MSRDDDQGPCMWVLVVFLVVLHCVCGVGGQLWEDCTTCSSSECKEFIRRALHDVSTPLICMVGNDGRYSLEPYNGGEYTVPGGFTSTTGERLNCVCETVYEWRDIQTKRGVVLDTDTTWSGNVTVTGLTKVANTATLTILPGTIVTFSAASSLISVAGKVIAIGTEESPIIFTKSSTMGSNAYHGGVSIANSALESSFQYCIFQYGVAGITVNNAAGINVDSSTFQFNQYGLLFYYASISVSTIKNSRMINTVRDGVQVSAYSKAVFHGCDFIANNGNGALLLVVGYADVAVNSFQNCTFMQNVKYGFFAQNSAGTILHSTLTQNQMGGAFVNTFEDITIAFSNIYNNSGADFNFPNDGSLPSRLNSAVYNLKNNYWGSTSVSFPDYFSNINLPIVYVSPVYSQVYPCSDCSVDIPKTIPSNYILENTTWGPDDGVINLDGPTVFAVGYTLTILPGAVISFNNGSLLVDGTLQCSGTAANPVRFVGNNQNDVALRTSFTITYVIFENLSQIWVTSQKPSFENSVFRNIEVIHFESTFPYAEILVLNSTLSGINTGLQFNTGIVTLNIIGCIIHNNSVMGISAYTSDNFTVNIYNSTFYDINGPVLCMQALLEGRLNAFYNDFQCPQGCLRVDKVAATIHYNNFINTNPIYAEFPSMNSTIDLRYNHFGTVTDECFWSDTLSDIVTPKSHTSIEFNPVLTGPFRSSCVADASDPLVSNCLTYTKPVTNLTYDKCRVCGGDNSTCTNCPSQPQRPYTCYNSTCQHEPLDCIIGVRGPPSKTCWNNNYYDAPSQSGLTRCDPFPRCLVDMPKRCPDGTCIGSNDTCTTSQMTCPYTTCPEGACSSECWPYNGCPVDTIICPDGSCVTDAADCSSGCAAGLYSCWDNICRAVCPSPPWSESILQIAASVGSKLYMMIKAPSGAYISISLKTKIQKNLYAYPVVDSTLRTFVSPWTYGGFEHNIVSLVVYSTQAGAGVISNAVVSFSPVTLLPDRKYCLGFVNRNNTWECQAPVYQNTSTQVFATTDRIETYMAVIIDVDDDPPTPVDTTITTTSTTPSTTSTTSTTATPASSTTITDSSTSATASESSASTTDSTGTTSTASSSTTVISTGLSTSTSSIIPTTSTSSTSTSSNYHYLSTTTDSTDSPISCSGKIAASAVLLIIVVFIM